MFFFFFRQYLKGPKRKEIPFAIFMVLTFQVRFILFWGPQQAAFRALTPASAHKNNPWQAVGGMLETDFGLAVCKAKALLVVLIPWPPEVKFIEIQNK